MTKIKKTIVSLDYLIMASSEKEFNEYEQNIACEYLQHYTKEEYFTGRQKFLSSALNKDVIFPSSFFAKYNDLAKNNIKKVIAQINNLNP